MEGLELRRAVLETKIAELDRERNQLKFVRDNLNEDLIRTDRKLNKLYRELYEIKDKLSPEGWCGIK